VIAEDARLVAFNRCLRLGYLAHFTREWITIRPFWSEDFRSAFEVFGPPGAQRLALALFFVATTAQLFASLLALWRPTRGLILVSTLALMLEAVVMPIGIPNHVALMLAALTFQAVMLLWRREEAATVRGLCAILITGYACAAIHKMNGSFADVLDGVLGHRLPHALVLALALGTVAVELGVPALALFSRRARPLLMLGLLALHFPMNSTLVLRRRRVVRARSRVPAGAGLATLRGRRRCGVVRAAHPARPVHLSGGGGGRGLRTLGLHRAELAAPGAAAQ
jgi:hypothetical protein